MRILVIVGAAAATLFVLAAVLLALLVDPNKYKGDITKLVREKTGRELVFEGDVKLAYFPRLGVQTGGISLGNPPAFGVSPFARVAGASVSVRLMPLFTGKVEVGRVSLDGLELNLMRNEQGLSNWADLTGPETPESKPAKPDTSGSGLSGLSLDALRIAGARIGWDDRQTGRKLALSGIDVDVKAIRPGQPFDFSAACQVDSRQPEYTARAELSGQATLNLPDDRHILSNLRLTVSAAGKAVPGGKGEFAIGLSELKADMQRQTAQGVGLTLSAYGAAATGQFQAANLKDAPEIKGRLDVPEFNGRELSAALTGKAKDAPDLAAYQRISGSLEYKLARGYTEIPTFQAALDEAKVEGRLRVVGIEKKSVSFNIRMDGLDADRFLPPKKAEAAKEAAPKDAPADPAAAGKDELFSVAGLRGLSLDGQISAERLKARGLRIQSLRLPMSAQNGLLEIGPAEARLYEGGIKAGLKVDVQGAEPVSTLTLSLSGIQAKPLFTDLNGRESQFAGTMQAEATAPLVGRGNTAQAIKRTLLGRVRFAVRDGVFPGVNVTAAVTEGARKAKRAVDGVDPGPEKSTKFGSIEGTAVITDGVVAINDLDLKAPFLRGDGKGTINLASKEVDYTLSARVVPSAEGQGGSAGLIGLVVPIRVTGPYDNPSYGTDYLRAIGKGAIDAVGGVVKGIGNVLTGKSPTAKPGGATPEKKPGLLDGVKKLF